MMPTNRIVIAIWVLLGVFALTLADWQFGGLPLASRGVTLLAGFAALWLPVACVALLGFLPRCRARAWAFVGLVPAASVCLVFGLVVVLGQAMPLWTRQSAVRLGHSEIVTYFTDAGAWDSGGTIVQQEITVLPGLLWVKPLSSKDYMRDVSVTVLDRHHVRCAYAADKYHLDDPSSAAQKSDIWVF
jgi:hypothetical protein